MTVEEKRNLIEQILITLKSSAMANDLTICVGDTFFSLAFKSDDELLKIGKLSGCS